jgi:DNA-binding transcriptional LysR family regulator
MSDAWEQLQDVRLADLEALLRVRRTGTLAGAARELRVTPSQISKTLARLEKLLGEKLLVRSTQGVTLSRFGEGLVPVFEDVVERLRALRAHHPPAPPPLTVASLSYLSSLFLPLAARSGLGVRLRSLLLTADQLRTRASGPVFDAAFLFGEPRFPSAWVTERVAPIPFLLLGSPTLKTVLGGEPVPVARVREAPFVAPVAFLEGSFVPVDDHCPLGLTERRRGHEAQSLDTALEFAAATDQLVFAPSLSARRHLEAGTLAPIDVEGWQVTVDLFLSCHADRVTERSRRHLVAAAREVVTTTSDGRAPGPARKRARTSRPT